VAARNGGEGPDDKSEDAEEVDAAGGAVCELDEGRYGGMMLDHGSIAEGPMVAAASAGAGGADGGSPDDDGDVVREDEPGETAERGGGMGCRGCGGWDGGGHAEWSEI
jgi:hypothetical protein